MIFYGTSLTGDVNEALDAAIAAARNRLGRGFRWTIRKIEGENGTTDWMGQPKPDEVIVEIEASAVFSLKGEAEEVYDIRKEQVLSLVDPVVNLHERESLVGVVQSIDEGELSGFPDVPSMRAPDRFDAQWQGGTIYATTGQKLAEIHQWHLRVLPSGDWLLNGMYGIHYNPNPDDFMKVVVYDDNNAILWTYVPDLRSYPCKRWFRFTQRPGPRFPSQYFSLISRAELIVRRSTWGRCAG